MTNLEVGGVAMAEQKTYPSASALAFDLERVPVPERSRAWSRWVPQAFAALEVVELSGTPVGVAWGLPLGGGTVWRIVSSSQRLRSVQQKVAASSRSALLLQRRGVSEVHQQERMCRLAPGEFALIDSTRPFTLDTIGMTEVILVDIPHAMAEAHFPALMARSATAFSSATGEARLLCSLLETLLESGEAMAEAGRNAAWRALLQLIAGLPLAEQRPAPPIPRRLRQAFADIELLLEDPALSAGLLAQRQGISRRQLDSLFVTHTGRTVAAQILERRLTQAAADLSDSQLSHLSITDIAYRAGFKDSAHFTRAFRQRFGSTPSAWRRAAR
ncbi:MAG: helix-turn-helix domain-containing protein [Spongiibacteraceae bacterium]|nr:helix-turn-helix domain-containing protein [Spongiibacteraceae bacterium]